MDEAHFRFLWAPCCADFPGSPARRKEGEQAMRGPIRARKWSPEVWAPRREDRDAEAPRTPVAGVPSLGSREDTRRSVTGPGTRTPGAAHEAGRRR